MAAKTEIGKPAAATEPAAQTRPPAIAPLATVSQTKDKIMANAKTPDFTRTMTEALSEMQARTAAACDKSTAAASEMAELAKGNVEALVESGKVLAGGAQALSRSYAEEARSAYDTLTADLKEAAAVKSPAELFQLQSRLARRNFDALAAFGSKNTDALIELAGEAFAPISGRIGLAAEKISRAA